jgi:hypothetical protein
MEPQRTTGALARSRRLLSTIGILAIIFALIGLLDVAITATSIGDLRYDRDLDAAVGWMVAWIAISVALFGLQFAGGVLARRSRRAAIAVLTTYGVAAIALAVIDIAVMSGWHRRPGLSWEIVSGMRRIIDVLALPWPSAVTALVHSRSVKTAIASS